MPTKSSAAPVVVVDITGSPPTQSTSDTMEGASPKARVRTQVAAARVSVNTRAEAQAQPREPQAGAAAGGEQLSRQGKRKAGNAHRTSGATQAGGGTAAAGSSRDGKRPGSDQSARNGKRKAASAVATNEPSRSKRRIDGAAVAPVVASTAGALTVGGVVTRSVSAAILER